MSFPNEKNRDSHIQIISTASSVSCQCCQLKEDKREIFTAASLPSQVSPQGRGKSTKDQGVLSSRQYSLGSMYTFVSDPKSGWWTKTYLAVTNNHYIWPPGCKTPQRALLADSAQFRTKTVYFGFG